jgi:hypothetical protein
LGCLACEARRADLLRIGACDPDGVPIKAPPAQIRAADGAVRRRLVVPCGGRRKRFTTHVATICGVLP